jgi:hypothetical protein
MMLGHEGDHAVRVALALTDGRPDVYAPLLRTTKVATPRQTELNVDIEPGEPLASVASASTDDRLNHVASTHDATVQVPDAADASNEDICLL